MSAVHFILQGKGGVGKSLIASFLTQYLQESNTPLLCIDTDPINHTFSQYKALNVKRLNILEDESHINSRIFDDLVEMIIKHEGISVIDNGASSFVPLSAYIKENNLIDFLGHAKKEVFIHIVITGGQSMDDTFIGLATLLDRLNANFIIWENEFFGTIEKNGKKLKEFNVIENHKEKIKGFVTLHKRNYDTSGKDIELIISNKLTFNEAIESEHIGLMPRQRLKIIKDNLFEQLRSIGI